MAVPKRKKSKQAKRSRRSHDSLETPQLTTCPQCKAPCKPHRVCSSCGFYKGKEYIDVEAKLKKKKDKQNRGEGQ